MLLLAAVLVISGCQASFPADAQGTLERATGGELRIGISENPPWTQVAPDGTVSGSEVDLVTGYAESIDAEIEWMPAGESALAAEMKAGALDIVIGGFPKDAPWTSHIAFTRPYATATGPDGKKVEIVLGVRPGENALLVDLERYLADHGGEL